MRRTVRFASLFMAIVMMFSLAVPGALAAGTAIDTTTASDGYFTVNYGAQENVKMKVGVTHGAQTAYYTYQPGDAAAYAFTEGDGDYTITLYRNTTGTKYKKVESTSVKVALTDEMVPYLVSTDEITFAADDAVGRTAAALCAGLTKDTDKIVAIHNYIAGRFTYDKAFGAQVAAGQIKNYVPDTNKTLASGTGVCYDFSALFAAMCRSQGVPCVIVRGYVNGSYHAWNMVYAEGAWQLVDMTREVSNRNAAATTLAACVTASDGYTVAA